MREAANLHKGGVVAPDDLVEHLRELIGVHGIRGTQEHLQVARETIARLLGGLGVRRGTLALVREQLRRIRCG
jgi:hypothetical protein